MYIRSFCEIQLNIIYVFAGHPIKNIFLMNSRISQLIRFVIVIKFKIKNKEILIDQILFSSAGSFLLIDNYF
jgi:hypothetical protein